MTVNFKRGILIRRERETILGESPIRKLPPFSMREKCTSDGLFVFLRKKGSKMKTWRTKEEEIEKGDYWPPNREEKFNVSHAAGYTIGPSSEVHPVNQTNAFDSRSRLRVRGGKK